MRLWFTDGSITFTSQKIVRHIVFAVQSMLLRSSLMLALKNSCEWVHYNTKKTSFKDANSNKDRTVISANTRSKFNVPYVARYVNFGWTSRPMQSHLRRELVRVLVTEHESHDGDEVHAAYLSRTA